MQAPRIHMSRHGRPLACALSLAWALAAAPAIAQTGAASASASGMSGRAPAMAGSGAARGDLARADRNFVDKAAAGGMAEVEAGKLGAQHAANAEVKQFAQKMVDDHTKANDELKTLAMAKGMTLPAAPDSAARRHMDSMGKKTGAAFDRDFMAMMVGDHKKTVDLFKKQADGGKDAELKAFAAAKLPTLEEHLQMAQQLNDKVKR